MKKIIFIFILLLPALLSGADNLGIWGEKLDLDISPGGDLFISYSRGNTIYFKYQEGGIWKPEKVVQGSDGNYDSRFPSRLAVDQEGNVHFSFANKSRNKILYNKFIPGTGWAGLEEVLKDKDNQVNKWDTHRNSIKVNGSRKVIICASTDQAVKCRGKNINGKFSSFPDKLKEDDYEPKYQFLGSNLKLPYMICLYSWKGVLYGNEYKGNNWLPSSNFTGDCCTNNGSIFIDDQGNIYVSWIVWTDEGEFSDLHYMENIGGIWKQPEVIISGYNYFDCPYNSECMFPEVAVTLNGTRIIVYSSGGGSSKVKIAYKKPGSSWKKETLSGSYSNHSAIAVEGNKVHVVYTGNKIFHEAVNFGTASDPTATPSPVPSPTATPEGDLYDLPIYTDLLQGSTLGIERGTGKFLPGSGWASTGGNILYDLGEASEMGYSLFLINEWEAPASGTEKNHIVSGWEEEAFNHHNQTGSFWNLRIGSRYNPFKFLASPAGLLSRKEIRLGNNSLVNDGEEHLYRFEWNKGKISFLFDGDLLHTWNFPRMKIRYILIGKDDLYNITDPAPVFHKVEIGKLVYSLPDPTATPSPTSTATPSPDPTSTATPSPSPTATPSPDPDPGDDPPVLPCGKLGAGFGMILGFIGFCYAGRKRS